MSANTGPAITTVAYFGASFASALATMGEVGQPVINQIESGINSLGTDLEKFAGSSTFKDFITWLQANGPVVGHDLESMGQSVGKIVTQFAGSGLAAQQTFTDALKLISNISGPVAGGLETIIRGVDGLVTALDRVIVPAQKFVDEWGQRPTTRSTTSPQPWDRTTNSSTTTPARCRRLPTSRARLPASTATSASGFKDSGERESPRSKGSAPRCGEWPLSSVPCPALSKTSAKPPSRLAPLPVRA